MGMDWMYLGPTPADEDCAQVGTNNFRQRAKKEMTAYCNQLYRQFPDATEIGVRFKIHWEMHDFGEYGEVVALYSDDNDKAYEYAINVEHNLPESWDDEALKELAGGMNESV